MSKLALFVAVVLATVALAHGAVLPAVRCTNCDRLVGQWEGFLYTRTYSTWTNDLKGAHRAFPLSADEFGCMPQVTMAAKAVHVNYRWDGDQLLYALYFPQGASYDAEGEKIDTAVYISNLVFGKVFVNAIVDNGLLVQTAESDSAVPVTFCVPAEFDWDNDEITIQFFTAGSDFPTSQTCDRIDYNVVCETEPAPYASSFLKLTKSKN